MADRREIVDAFQGGSERAEYGTALIQELSRRLMERYGKGFSTSNLAYFRQLYLAFSDRTPRIFHTPRGKSGDEIFHPPRGKSVPSGFHPALSWSHYRALIGVEKPAARDFYESEAALCGWSTRQLERQIATLYYERLLRSRDKRGMLQESRQSGKGDAALQPLDVLKDPYILEFLDLPGMRSRFSISTS